MKILIGAPISDAKKYCWEEFKDGLHAAGEDVLLVDTSRGRLMKMDIKTEGFNYQALRRDKPMDSVVVARDFILQYAIEHEYDYVLMIDADIILTDEVIPQLLLAKKDIVTCLIPSLDQDGMPAYPHFLSETERVPVEAKGEGLIKAHKVGFGCVLISREAFTKVNYIRCERFPDGKLKQSEDYCFSDDAISFGLELWVDTELEVKHKMVGQWDWEKA